MGCVFNELEPKLAGELEINEGEVLDITDPCYDKDVWCRINGVKVKPGVYECFSYIDTDDMYQWGARPWASMIKLKGAVNTGNWNLLGTIGVDAGLAGYFVDKPDFDDNAWLDLCKYMNYDSDGHNENFANGLFETFISNDPLLHYKGFWTESGAGDGGYEVYSLKDSNGDIVALKIDFYGEDYGESYDEEEEM